MVAIVAGSGLGLLDTSAFQQNGPGIVGDGNLGHNNGNATVNVANGNLILQFTDETLAGSGADIHLQRSYNSQGDLTGTDHWRWMGEKRIEFVNPDGRDFNESGTAVHRISGDGHRSIYHWDDNLYKYISSDGDGANDSLEFLGDRWLWVEGSTRLTESYDIDTGWISASKDSSGNGFEYNIANGLLQSVTDIVTQQAVVFFYNASGQVWQVQTFESNGSDSSEVTRTKQVNYRYDSLGRLSDVISDLTLDNAIFGDTSTYRTTYSYHGDSYRVASIVQSDGTVASYTYSNVNGEYKIETVTDKYGTTRFDYSVDVFDQNLTTVVNSLGQIIDFTMDDQDRIISVKREDQIFRYEYDERDNVVSITDGKENTIRYEYDIHSNLIREENSVGDIIERSYGSRGHGNVRLENVLLSESRFVDGEEQKTFFIYDSDHRLRFTIKPEGGVSEIDYDSYGRITKRIDYIGSPFDASLLTEDAIDLNSNLTFFDWFFEADRSKIQLTEYQYNHLGQLEREINFGSVDSEGEGILDASANQTEYVYSVYGELLQTIAVTGANRNERTTLESRVYDGIGRLIGQANQSGSSTTAYYVDVPPQNRGDEPGYDFQKVQVINSNGVTVTSAYDNRGRLVSVNQEGANQIRTTSYYYDDAGRLTMTENAQGAREFIFYNAVGQVSYRVSALGDVTGYEYNEEGRLHVERQYATAVSTADWFSGGQVTQTSVSIDNHLEDRSTIYQYDDAGRIELKHEVLYGSLVTEAYNYDNASQLTSTTVEDERLTRYTYDKDGRITGTLNAENYLAENVYDEAGRLIRTVRYPNRVTTIDGTLEVMRNEANQDNADTNYVETARTQYFFYDAQGRLVGEVDENGYLTETVFNVAQRQTLTHRYMDAIVVTPDDTFESVKQSLADSEIRTTTQMFDFYGRLEVTRAHDGTSSRNIYDSFGRLLETISAEGEIEETATRIRYNAFGEVTGEVSGVGEVLVTNKSQAIDQYGVSYEYDLLGRRILEKGPHGQKTFFFYDAEGSLVYTVNGMGQVKEYTYNTFGEISSERKLEKRISTEFLTGGIVTNVLTDRVNSAKNSEKDHYREYQYNTLGLLEREIDSFGRATIFTYNDFGELDIVRRPKSNGQITESYNYDNLGRETRRTFFNNNQSSFNGTMYDGFGRIYQTYDANSNDYFTEYSQDHGAEYDGQTVTTVNELGDRSSTTYDALDRITRFVDGKGAETSYTYDDINRVIHKTTPGVGILVNFGGPAPSQPIITTTKSYDRLGQVISETNGNGVETQYFYDKSGNLKTIIDGEQNTTTHNYDRAGRLVETIDANSNNVKFYYDSANQMTHKIYDPDGKNIRTVYSYDGIGQIFSKSEGTSRRFTRYEYDSEGQLKQEILDPSGLNPLLTTYEYDEAGNQIEVARGSVSNPNQQVVEYLYDLAGRKTHEILDPGEGKLNITTEFQYDDNGNLVQEIDPRGNRSWYIYNAANQLAYEVNALGNVTQYFYDANSALVETRQYANSIDTAQFDTQGPLFASPPTSVSGITLSSLDRRTVRVLNDLGSERFTLTYTDFFDGWAVTENVYDNNGNIIETRRFDKYLTSDEVENMRLPVSYDAAAISENDVIDNLTNNGYLAKNWPSANLDEFLELGLSRVTHFAYDNNDRLRFTIDPNGHVSEIVYDDVGNIRYKTQYATKISGLDHDYSESNIAANLILDTENDRTTEYQYDALNRLEYEISGEATFRTSDGNTYIGRLKTRNYYTALGEIYRIDEGIIQLRSGVDITTDMRKNDVCLR